LLYDYYELYRHLYAKRINYSYFVLGLIPSTI